jgi:hypothetical protein
MHRFNEDGMASMAKSDTNRWIKSSLLHFSGIAARPLHPRSGLEAPVDLTKTSPAGRPARGSGAAGGGLPVRRHCAAAVPRCSCQVSIKAMNKRLTGNNPRVGASAPELNSGDPSTGSGDLEISARRLPQSPRLGRPRGDPRRGLRPDGHS